MNLSLIDLGGLLLATACYGIILVLPGAGLVSLCGLRANGEDGDEAEPLLPVLAGVAILPGLDSIAAKIAGLDVALAINLALALFAMWLIGRKRPWPSLSWLALALLLGWVTIVAIESIDYDVAGAIHQPFTVVDMVKHAATTQAIHDTGAPPRDPFFFRSERVSYYYFFYTLAALCQRACGGLVDARAAVGGLTVWTGVALYGVLHRAITRSGLVNAASRHRVRPVLLLLLAAGGLDILFVLRAGVGRNAWLPDPTWWTDEAGNWLDVLLWVPHHVSGMIAALVGFIVLADTIGADDRPAARPILAAALCFVSTFGLSVWLTLAAVVTAGLWFGWLLLERRWRAATILGLAGLAALLIAAPAIADLRSGRAGAIPITFAVRLFAPTEFLTQIEPARSIVRLVMLPINYMAEFGILFLGTMLFWQTNRQAPVHRSELARVLTLAAIAGLILGSFFRSNFFGNNDLGWRVLMVSQAVGVIWTAAFLIRLWEAKPTTKATKVWRLLPLTPLVFLCIGYGTTLYNLVSLRAYGVMPMRAEWRLLRTDAEDIRALRLAYGWANHHMAASQVLQHNPTAGERAVNFGLYSRNPVGVSDFYGSLYGASGEAIERRMEDILPVFLHPLADDEVRRRATKNGIEAIVVAADDPVWAMSASFVWRSKPLYESARVRIIPVSSIGMAASGSVR